MKIVMLFGLIFAVVSASQVATPQSKPSFLQDSRIHRGYEDDAAAPLIPEIHAAIQGDEPEGGSNPFAAGKDVVEWSEESQVPQVLQWTFAGLWIFMLASMPFIMPVMDAKPVTRTQKVVGGSMLTVLFGGFYLFTNVILFQSIHFKTIRPLTMIECIYFMAQVITTVGYGDITPAKIRGQVFVGIYVLGALFIISMLISDLTNHMVQMAADYKAKVAAKKAAEQTPRTPKSMSIQDLVQPEKPSTQPLLIALAVFGILDLLWICFFSMHPREGKTLFQAVYMSVITLSTVGFGWFTPVTESGMIFGAFMMLFGSAALVNVIGNFTDLMVKMNNWERFNAAESQAEAMELLDGVTDNSETVNEAEFLKFALLQIKSVSQSELDYIHEAFHNLEPTKNGTVKRATIKESLDTLHPTETPAAVDDTKK